MDNQLPHYFAIPGLKYKSTIPMVVTTTDVMKAVSKATGVDMHVIKGLDRHKKQAEARQIFIYLALQMVETTQSHIARILHRDNSSIFAGNKVCQNRMQTEELFFNFVKQIKEDVIANCSVSRVGRSSVIESTKDHRS